MARAFPATVVVVVPAGGRLRFLVTVISRGGPGRNGQPYSILDRPSWSRFRGPSGPLFLGASFAKARTAANAQRSEGKVRTEEKEEHIFVLAQRGQTEAGATSGWRLRTDWREEACRADEWAAIGRRSKQRPLETSAGKGVKGGIDLRWVRIRPSRCKPMAATGARRREYGARWRGGARGTALACGFAKKGRVPAPKPQIGLGALVVLRLKTRARSTRRDAAVSLAVIVEGAAPGRRRQQLRTDDTAVVPGWFSMRNTLGSDAQKGRWALT